MNVLVLLLTAMAPAGDGCFHDKANPIYHRLRRQGILIADKQYLPLPRPVLADGLDAEAQQEVIKNVLGGELDLDNFLDESVTAPQWIRQTVTNRGNPATPIRSVDLYFVAYGNVAPLADKAVLQSLITVDTRKPLPRPLSAKALKVRGITIPEGANRQESFDFVDANIMVRVKVRAVGHSYWSLGSESLVAAVELDERFAQDREFPNQWLPLIKGSDGVKEGQANPYFGAGYYVKITPLKKPAGALFVEAHIAFAEPAGWFRGENPLGPKLPAATMAVVRNFRRELNRMSR